jgi:2-polyprenyl-3-methyl-5-hydroxy-6-metoxy-1,4-benzoquinol methylase
MLEIGAGTGYVSRRFIDIGWKVDALEPGIGYAEKWSEYNVDVINSFYPCEDISDKKYDAIIAYTVLEHISNTEMFLKEISKQLAPNGKVFIAVPNCSDEIALADPSMLLHEHFQYFTRKSLEAAMKEVNLTASVSCSKFGRLLYAVAEKSSSEKQTKKLSEQFSDNESYFLRVSKTRDVVAKKLAQLSTNGPVGIYCPSRALYFLSDKSNYRFFDDAAYLHDKFLPPFYSKIESREAFLADPPAYCVIFSRTFGSVLKTELSIALKSGGKTSTILTIDEIISNGLGVETSA